MSEFDTEPCYHATNYAVTLRIDPRFLQSITGLRFSVLQIVTMNRITFCVASFRRVYHIRSVFRTLTNLHLCP